MIWPWSLPQGKVLTLHGRASALGGGSLTTTVTPLNGDGSSFAQSLDNFVKTIQLPDKGPGLRKKEQIFCLNGGLQPLFKSFVLYAHCRGMFNFLT